MSQTTDLSEYKDYIPLAEAAVRAEGYASESTLRRWIKSGHLPAIRRGRLGYYVHPDDLKRALVQPVGTDRIDEAVREVVARAPRLTPEQVATINDALAASATREGDAA